MQKLLFGGAVSVALAVIVWIAWPTSDDPTGSGKTTSPQGSSSPAEYTEQASVTGPSPTGANSLPQKNKTSSTGAPEANLTTPATGTTATPSPEISELEQKLQTIETAAELTSEESLSTLVSYATDSDSKVRKEALNAIIRRDDSAAVDMLRKAAKKSDDSAVIIALLQTADYLAQPAFSFRTASEKTTATEGSQKPSAK